MGGLAQRVRIAPEDADPGAGVEQRVRDRASDRAAATGHDRDLADEGPQGIGTTSGRWFAEVDHQVARLDACA